MPQTIQNDVEQCRDYRMPPFTVQGLGHSRVAFTDDATTVNPFNSGMRRSRVARHVTRIFVGSHGVAFRSRCHFCDSIVFAAVRARAIDDCGICGRRSLRRLSLPFSLPFGDAPFMPDVFLGAVGHLHRAATKMEDILKVLTVVFTNLHQISRLQYAKFIFGVALNEWNALSSVYVLITKIEPTTFSAIRHFIHGTRVLRREFTAR
ncbi:hypothetical protein L596_002682 [Steinernema carpocapsae]|uniref:Uncharacterized protein n=1 Tax=Steinernema carpocapsae TaxID=34508 RepID=A0A4U8URS1_STECR|nr:hypothetical protein L596_002682 [Steinernema carpocapsae]